MIKLPYVVRDAEKCSTSCTFFSVYFVTQWCFPQDNQWILLLYSILYDNYETNLLCLDCRIENNMKMSNFSSTESPWSAGKRVTLPQCESQLEHHRKKWQWLWWQMAMIMLKLSTTLKSCQWYADVKGRMVESSETAFILSTNTIRCHVNDMVFFSEREGE